MLDAPDAEAVLEVADLQVCFDADGSVVTAVEDVSFKVFSGRTVGIVGESGCGKSVTARAIMRITDGRSRVARGQIRFRSRAGLQDLARLPADGSAMRAIRGREIALIFQEPMTSFSPVHTIGEQIVEAICLHTNSGKRGARRLAISQLSAVGTPHPEHIIDQYAWELSGGLRQRAMIAMALVCEPALLIADEPTTALDVTTQAQVIGLLGDLRRERRMGMILITHDLGVVAQAADEVVVMYLGMVVEQGPVRSVFSAPRHPYTRALLKSMPSVAAKPRARLDAIRGSVPGAANRPSGCPFHPRCNIAVPGTCDTIVPPSTETIDGRLVRCHVQDET